MTRAEARCRSSSLALGDRLTLHCHGRTRGCLQPVSRWYSRETVPERQRGPPEVPKHCIESQGCLQAPRCNHPWCLSLWAWLTWAVAPGLSRYRAGLGGGSLAGFGGRAGIVAGTPAFFLELRVLRPSPPFLSSRLCWLLLLCPDLCCHRCPTVWALGFLPGPSPLPLPPWLSAIALFLHLPCPAWLRTDTGCWDFPGGSCG